jgi:hypothetical protein
MSKPDSCIKKNNCSLITEKMKKICGFFLFAFITSALNSQQIYLEAGKVLSSFDYKNSARSSLGDLKGTSQNSLGLGFRMPVLQSAFHVSLGVANDKYGATSTDPVLGNYSEWNVSYIGVNLGIDYEFLKPQVVSNDRHGFSFYVKGVCATDFLLNGKQRLNNMVFDLSGVEEFDKPVYFLKGGVGVYYYITRSYIAFSQYMFGRSILIGNYDGQEQLHYITHCITIGFSVNLVYKR